MKSRRFYTNTALLQNSNSGTTDKKTNASWRTITVKAEETPPSLQEACSGDREPEMAGNRTEKIWTGVQ